jgi:Cleaved Adhesin Domain
MLKKYMLKSLFTFCLLTTSVALGQTVIFTEDFESGIPSTWGVRNLDGKTPAGAVSEYAAAYISKMDPDDTNNLTASSTSFFSPVGIANRWLITESIALGGYGNSFQWKAKSHDPSYPETYLVLVSTSDTLIASFTDTLGYVVQENEDWTTRTVNLSALGYNNQTIYVAFILQTDDGFKFYLDDVTASKEDPVGLQEETIIQLSIKALDNDGLFEINSELSFDQIVVYDEMGKVVVEANSKIIDLRQEKSGLYFVQARKDNELFFSKLKK